jgi:hypothetical protein
MNHIIEQQKERAGKLSIDEIVDGLYKLKKESNDRIFLQAIKETLEEAHQATIAEVVRIAEGRKRLEMNDDYDGGYNHACDDLIEAITSNKE